MTDTVSVSFKCEKCGAKIVWPDDIIDSTEVFCANCGESAGTYSDLRDTAMSATRDRVSAMLKDAFKRR